MALDPIILGSDPKYVVDQGLQPNLISSLSVAFGSYKIKGSA